MKPVPLLVGCVLTIGACHAQVLGTEQYTIWTAAGGPPPITAVSGVASHIGSPQGIASDGAGNVYFSSSLHCVFRLDTGGNLTRVAGNARPGYSGDGGPATSAMLNGPVGVAVDTAGNLFIADKGNYRVRQVSPDGIITTIAGSGAPGYSGDGGPAASAQLTAPAGVAVDGAGDLYIADAAAGSQGRVRVVAPSGLIGTVAGGGNSTAEGVPAVTSLLNSPTGVAVDASGNIYIAEDGSNRVREITPDGAIKTVAGTGAAGHSGDGGPGAGAMLNDPYGIAVDGAGNLYIADRGNNVVRMVAPGGTISTVAGNGAAGYQGDGGPATSAVLSSPPGVAVDGSGNLFIPDPVHYVVREAAAGGLIATVAGNGTTGYSGDGGPAAGAGLNGPSGVAVDGAGAIYIADTGNSRVRKVAIDGTIDTVAGAGTPGYFGDGGPASAAKLNSPAGVAVDAGGNLYISDTKNSRVRRVSPAGTIVTVAGNGSAGYSGDGGPATGARLNNPGGLAVDAAGNLYIADTENNRVRMVSPGGTITTVAGGAAPGYAGDGGPATAAQLYWPAAVAVDGAGNLYIADKFNHRIREVSASGTISTIAGTGIAGFSGDGGPATAAQLQADGVAVDRLGAVFIADTGNYRVRVVSPLGVISTIAGTGRPGYSGDGGPAGYAELSGPESLAVDATGNIYVADSAGDAIRAMRPGASQLTIATPSALPPGKAGVAYSQTLAASLGSLPYKWSLAAGALPDGLSLSSGGTIAGVPTVGGTSTFDVTVTDALLNSTRRAFSLSIAPVALTLTAATLPPGYVGGPYYRALSAAGGVPGYTWSIAAGALPPGLTLSLAGEIMGTPTTVGSYTFTARVFDALSVAATQSFTMVVTATATRVGVFSQLVAGGGWDTTIWLVNRTTAPLPTRLLFYGDDGGPLTMPLTVTEAGVAHDVTAATLDQVIAPNTTLVVTAGNSDATVQGWVDVIGSGSLSGFAVFRIAGLAEAAVPLQGQVGTSFSLPFDNTDGYSTGVAIVNLFHSAASLSVSIWDENGNRLVEQPVALALTDAAGGGHDTFMLPDRLPVTAGKRGIVQFHGNPGTLFTPAGTVTGLGLRVSPEGLFSSIPTLVP